MAITDWTPEELRQRERDRARALKYLSWEPDDCIREAWETDEEWAARVAEWEAEHPDDGWLAAHVWVPGETEEDTRARAAAWEAAHPERSRATTSAPQRSSGVACASVPTRPSGIVAAASVSSPRPRYTKFETHISDHEAYARSARELLRRQAEEDAEYDSEQARKGRESGLVAEMPDTPKPESFDMRRHIEENWHEHVGAMRRLTMDEHWDRHREALDKLGQDPSPPEIAKDGEEA